MTFRLADGIATPVLGWPKLGLMLIAALALLVGLPVYSFVLSMDSGLAWANIFYSAFVSKEWAEAPSAYEATQRGYLHTMSPFMKLHVGGMATALAFGWLQFIPALRRKHPHAHRVLGGVLVLGMLLGGIGSLAMVFGGGTYGSSDYGQQLTVSFGMVSLTLFVWASMLLAIRWVMAGDVRQHGDWMVMTYSLICTAITLRIGFFVYGWQGHSFEESFHLSTQFAIQPMVLAAVWIIARRRRVALRHTEATPATVPLWRAMTAWLPASSWPILMMAFGGLLMVLALANVLPFHGYQYHLGVRLSVMVVAIAALVAGVFLEKAQRSGQPETAAQWGVRAAVLLAFPVLSLALWGALLPTGKTTEVLLNTAPVFAAALVLYVPEFLISALTLKARQAALAVGTA